MATRAVSPGGALLRASRLFSLPQPLPAAPGDVSGSSNRMSDTSTMPFPTLQTVASPKSSRARGDWGFKRPLPPRAMARTASPLVRVKQVDSIEHVTDFASATDHAMTLRKWQDMNMPITFQDEVEQRQQLTGKSVFEEDVDLITADPSKKHSVDDKRWKFKGPWLAGITGGQFQAYLKKEVRRRRPEFREFLREQLAAEMNEAASAKAMESGEDVPPAVTASAITEAQLTEYLRQVRHDRPKLYGMVGKFLDLAPLQPSNRIFQTLGNLSPFASAVSRTATNNPWAIEGPPITHPSAGLSYLRTSAYLDNHPLYGPQKSHPQVQARVVAPRTAVGTWSAKLGVAGVIAETSFGETAFNTRHTNKMPGLNLIDPKIVGGAKEYVRLSAAKVDSQGRIKLFVTDADAEAVLVQKELQGQMEIFAEPSNLLAARPENLPRTASVGRYASRSVLSSPSAYGLAPGRGAVPTPSESRP